MPKFYIHSSICRDEFSLWHERALFCWSAKLNECTAQWEAHFHVFWMHHRSLKRTWQIQYTKLSPNKFYIWQTLQLVYLGTDIGTYSSTSSQLSLLHKMKNKFQQRWCITVDTLSLFCLVQYFTWSYLTFPCKYFYTNAALCSAVFHVTFTEILKPLTTNKTCTEIYFNRHWKSHFEYLNFPGKWQTQKELDMVWLVGKVKLMLTNWPDIFISRVLQISNSEDILS